MKMRSRHNAFLTRQARPAGGPAGFSLAELLTVLAITAILAAVALPVYNKHSEKLIRLDGQSKLLEVMAAQQEFFSENRRYTKKLGGELAFSDNAEEVLSDRGHYSIQAKACDSEPMHQCVLLRAAPVRTDNMRPPALTLDSYGRRTPPPSPK